MPESARSFLTWLLIGISLTGCGGTDDADTAGAGSVEQATLAAVGSIERIPLPGGSTFPIASAVVTRSDVPIVYHSGLVPVPKNADAEFRSRAYWGDTREQAMSVFAQMQSTLASMNLGFGDIIKMTAFLVGDNELDGRMDFAGFMEAYTQYFGTAAQPNLPARSAVQVEALANEGMLVEIEVILARPTAARGHSL